jgi:hypothetical protein
VAGPTVVEMARSAVRRLADAALVADTAREALELIERVGIGPPYTIAIAGDPAARTELLNCLAGQRLFDPVRHDPARVVMTLRRGGVTALRMRRRDGSVEQRSLGALPRARVADAAAPAGEPADRAMPPPDAPPAAPSPGRAEPVFVAEPRTTLVVRRPPWWAIWRWPMFWWRMWRTRGAVAALPAAASAAGVSAALAGEPAMIGALAAAVPVPEPLPEPERATPPPRRAIARTVERTRHPGHAVQPLVDAIRDWLADESVERLFVEAAGAPLAEDVVVIELPSRADPRSLDSVAADACLVACSERGFAMTAQLEGVLAIVPHLFAVGAPGLPLGGEPRVRLLGDFADAAPELVRLARLERQIAAGKRALKALAIGCAILDHEMTGAESRFRARLEQLEVLRIPDADDYTAAALARVRQTIVEHAHRLIQRALEQLDGAIDRSAAAWTAQLREATSTDALRSAAARLDEESPAALQAAQGEAHRALVDDLTEHARAHYRELVSELRRDTTRSDAVPSWLTVDVHIGDMTSGTSLGPVAPRLSSLFRSLDALKNDAVAQLDQRIAKLRQLASANLLDTEPRLEPAVTGAVSIALRADVERHSVWLEGELARERFVIDAERAQVAVLGIVRDAARADERQLSSAVASLSSELP